jgi:type III restriction enzyme
MEALGVVNLAVEKLDAMVGSGSAAHKQVIRLAEDVVAAYVNGVRLVQRKSNPFTVGSVMVRLDEMTKYDNAVHEGYSGLNGDEKAFAAAIDATGPTWARNPVSSGFRVPLISVGPTSFFYPDFLVWTEGRVILVDTKGEHLIREAAARKMLRIKPASAGRRLDVQFVSIGHYDDGFNQLGRDGYTAWGLADDGSVSVIQFGDLDALIQQLLDDSLHP